jgi:hypothetical protein
LRDAHDKGQAEWYNDLESRLDRIKEDKEKLLNTKEGEILGIDDLSEIYMQAMGEMREKSNLTTQSRTKTGEINDYLEVRRPFGAA